MLHLGSFLSVSDEKVQVTIERDPEAGKYTMKREIIPSDKFKGGGNAGG